MPLGREYQTGVWLIGVTPDKVVAGRWSEGIYSGNAGG
jgi:hypothetical protein